MYIRALQTRRKRPAPYHPRTIENNSRENILRLASMLPLYAWLYVFGMCSTMEPAPRPQVCPQRIVASYTRKTEILQLQEVLQERAARKAPKTFDVLAL